MLQHADDCKNPSFAETAYESSLPVSLPHLEAGHGIKSRTFFSEPFFATMGDLWRSEEMQLVQLFVQVEAARDTVDELGNMGVIQFRDVRCSLLFMLATRHCFTTYCSHMYYAPRIYP